MSHVGASYEPPASFQALEDSEASTSCFKMKSELTYALEQLGMELTRLQEQCAMRLEQERNLNHARERELKWELCALKKELEGKKHDLSMTRHLHEFDIKSLHRYHDQKVEALLRQLARAQNHLL